MTSPVVNAAMRCRLPSAERPVLAFEPFAIGDVLELDGRRIEVLSAAHTVPAVGFAVLQESGAWVFTGDTGPNPLLWERLRGMTVRHLVIETAFSNDEQAVANISGHLCPATLGRELARLEGPVDVCITHIKPGEVEAVMAEIRQLESDLRIHSLSTGDAFEL